MLLCLLGKVACYGSATDGNQPENLVKQFAAKSGWRITMQWAVGPFLLALLPAVSCKVLLPAPYDQSTSIVKACRELRVIHELSQPGIPQNNGQIESRNDNVHCGAKAALLKAGLPSCWWPYAVSCSCFLENE